MITNFKIFENNNQLILFRGVGNNINQIDKEKG